ncbi:flagellin N-terminal helical domain-containing protein [Allochromatium vinosum]|uniref:Flagellin n=1 Tax=Allochromatium vinosum (strain ATCC 17899 / DSM 180 / NBRC 103801 / NCIMB 10441 / D) TaxID=572477 RepID=D3RUL6_ALLVD|nr:flagellin [Allochromatium vinosum]ADC62875.1 flagellin domain protein [Allochromatium vinosum DSM 180]
MAMVINTNVMSLNAQRNLTKSQSTQGQAMERLSSGLRINSAKDDAAGSAIASRLTSQIRGFDQSVRNANDGISLVQTAEGALSESSNILQRMRELAVQSANGTYTSGNRTTLNAETQQLIKELDRISESTNFNGLNLLDGSAQEVKLQVGAEANQTISVEISAMDSSSLGIEKTAGVGSVGRIGTGTTAALATTAVNQLGTGDLEINGIAIDAAVAASDSASSAAKASSAISTAAAINAKTDQTGVSAVVGETQIGGNTMATSTSATGSIILNGVTIDLSTTTDTATTRAAVVRDINLKSEQTGVTAVDSGTDNGGITLVAADGRNIVLENSAGGLTAGNTGLGLAGASGNTAIATGTVTLVSEGNKPITISSGATGNASDVGFAEGTYNGSQVQVTSNLGANTTAMAAGNVFVNGVSVGPSYATDDTASSAGNDFSAISKAAAFNVVSDKTGVTAVVNENIAKNTTAQVTASAAVSGSINGVQITGFTTVAGAENNSLNRQALVDAINAVSEQTGVKAIDTGEDGGTTGGGVQLIAEDGRNIVANIANGANAGFNTGAGTYVGEFTLVSDKEIVITRGTDANISNSGFTVGEYGGGENGQSLKNVDISTVDGANKAIVAIDNALEKVNNVRSDLGAVNNRLDFTINNLTSISQNATASRSRIEDADFAAETAKLSRSQVLTQASQAMLAQANSAPQQVLSLLR